MKTADEEIAIEEIRALKGLPVDRIKEYAARAVSLNHVDFKRSHKVPMTREKSIDRDYQRERADNSRATGMCMRCGENQSREGRLHCLACTWKELQKREPRRKLSTCSLCGEGGHGESTCDVIQWAKENGYHGN